jgi:glucose/mannose-6-phosphate isomerase
VLSDSLSDDAVSRFDSRRIYSIYQSWPEFAERDSRISFQMPAGDYERIIYVASGGSASAGDIISDWLLASEGVELSVFKGYLPKVNLSKSLAIVCSTSGGTQDTIRLCQRLIAEKATMITLSSGGKLKEIADKMRIPHVSFPIELAPRYSLPHTLFTTISVLRSASLITAQEGEIKEAVEAMKKTAPSLSVETPISKNPAKRYAELVTSTIPKVYGSSITKGVAQRFKTCLNENAKIHVSSESSPELFHNEVESWESNDRRFTPIFLRHSAEPEPERERFDAFIKILEERGVECVQIRGLDGGNLAQLVSLVYQLDFATYYAAVLRGIDPFKVKIIDALKAH